MAGGLGTIIGAFAGEPKFDVKRNVKNDQIQDLIYQLMEAEKNAGFSNEWSITDLTKKFYATQGERQNQAKQEVGTLDRFYNGAIADELAQIRQARKAAYRDATDRAVSGINRGRNLGLLAGDVAGSSYLDRIALGQARDAEITGALDDVNQQKQDLNWLTGNQVNLAGRRGQIADSALMRILVPSQLRSQEVARKAGMFGAINALDKSNTFYGLSKDRTTLDQVGEGLDGLVQLAMEIYGTGALGGMGGMGGGMGGAGGGAGSAMGMLGSMGGGGGGGQSNAVRYESMFGGLAQ